MTNFDWLKPIVAEQPYPLLFATISGAHLYGFPSPDSDYDLRGVHVLPLREIVGLKQPKDTLDVNEVRDGIELDLVSYDVKKFIELLLKRSGNLLEYLLSPLVVHHTPALDELRAFAPACLTRHHIHHYVGFGKNQWELFQKEAPRRVKPLLYVYRGLLTGIYLMQTGQVEANLVHLNDHYKLPYIPDLIARKLAGGEHGALNNTDMTFHHSEYERLFALLEQAHEATSLPYNVSDATKTALNDFLLRVRGV
jgi:uncharacterized protein